MWYPVWSISTSPTATGASLTRITKMLASAMLSPVRPTLDRISTRGPFLSAFLKVDRSVSRELRLFSPLISTHWIPYRPRTYIPISSEALIAFMRTYLADERVD